MTKIQIITEIKSCKECPNFTTKNQRSTDDFDRMEDWHCNSADMKIQGAVEWHEERKIKIPDWCPILVKEASADASAVTVEYLSGKTTSNDDKSFGFESLPLYGYDADKHVIYNESTDKDVCMYFDDETRDMLLDLLNSSVKP